ncbi:hypothetical protein C7S15_6242 [Burkholderia cepacia]|nr:hypothetical protein [Burkholderia cepacia]
MFHSFRSQRDDVLHPYDDGGAAFIPGLSIRERRVFIKLSFIRQRA